MSISGSVGSYSGAQWRQPSIVQNQQTKGAAQSSSATGAASGGASSDFDSVVDGIDVNLPNGISVGVFRLDGGAGTSAQGGGISAGSAGNGSTNQMVDAVEQLVAALENYAAPQSSTASQDSSAATSAGGTTAGASGMSAPGASTEGIQIGMPNGFSFEVFGHGSGSSDGGSSGGSSDQMVQAAEQLVAALDKYPVAAPGAYGKASASGAATATGSVNAVA